MNHELKTIGLFVAAFFIAASASVYFVSSDARVNVSESEAARQIRTLGLPARNPGGSFVPTPRPTPTPSYGSFLHYLRQVLTGGDGGGGGETFIPTPRSTPTPTPTPGFGTKSSEDDDYDGFSRTCDSSSPHSDWTVMCCDANGNGPGSTCYNCDGTRKPGADPLFGSCDDGSYDPNNPPNGDPPDVDPNSHAGNISCGFNSAGAFCETQSSNLNPVYISCTDNATGVEVYTTYCEHNCCTGALGNGDYSCTAYEASGHNTNPSYNGEYCNASTGVPPATCNNNGTCDTGETATNCPADNCPPAGGVCNNSNTCDAGETQANCPQDCGFSTSLSCVADISPSDVEVGDIMTLSWSSSQDVAYVFLDCTGTFGYAAPHGANGSVQGPAVQAGTFSCELTPYNAQGTAGTQGCGASVTVEEPEEPPPGQEPPPLLPTCGMQFGPADLESNGTTYSVDYSWWAQRADSVDANCYVSGGSHGNSVSLGCGADGNCSGGDTFHGLTPGSYGCSMDVSGPGGGVSCNGSFDVP